MADADNPDIVIVTDEQLDAECPHDPAECDHEHPDEPSVYTQDEANTGKYHARCAKCGIIATQVNKGGLAVQDLNIDDKRPA